MYQRILVTTDGSPLSKKAVRGAIGLAAALDAQLVALHVVPRYPMSYFEGGMTVSPDDVARTEKQWNERARAMVDAVAMQAEAANVASKGVVVQSDLVAEAIQSAAKKHKCDLIVMASHGRRGLKRLLLGSETQHVLTHGTIPVLVLR
ncbi:universal stress protein [Caenimonas aquaedulcis]|uniref:Universal stress protein n=1 Tax=Caenimonas aquaedulcis TaxID=2793270 RepID=A0A931MIX7_9BURK|nr:universal stress protein [Caenimonas aquaedulcis]MBG9390183.1 universal stress protein [Caenimonas aquaedulcis]